MRDAFRSMEAASASEIGAKVALNEKATDLAPQASFSLSSLTFEWHDGAWRVRE